MSGKQDTVKTKSFHFALDTVLLCNDLQQKRKEYILTKQLLRSGTSIGAMVRESKYAESRADFVHKLAIVLKEANESKYWIELLCAAGYISTQIFAELNFKVEELLKLLTAIKNATKRNNLKH